MADKVTPQAQKLTALQRALANTRESQQAAKDKAAEVKKPSGS